MSNNVNERVKPIFLNKVEGWNPSEHLEVCKELATEQPRLDSKGNEMLYLPASVQKTWFRLLYPHGKIALEEIPSRQSEIRFRARVYLDRNDSEEAFVSEGYAAEPILQDAKYPPYETCQTRAIARALDIAGFGCEISNFSATGEEKLTEETAAIDDATTKSSTKRNKKTKVASATSEPATEAISAVVNPTDNEITASLPTKEIESSQEIVPPAEEDSDAIFKSFFDSLESNEEPPSESVNETEEEIEAIAEDSSHVDDNTLPEEDSLPEATNEAEEDTSILSDESTTSTTEEESNETFNLTLDDALNTIFELKEEKGNLQKFVGITLGEIMITHKSILSAISRTKSLQNMVTAKTLAAITLIIKEYK